MIRGEKIERLKMSLKFETDTVRLFFKKITVEDALDVLAATTIFAFVIMAFIMDGLLSAIPEDMTVIYMLMGTYLAVYIIHKFRVMK